MKNNLTQKIILAHLTKASEMKVGEEIYLKMDQTLTHDITAVMAYLAFEKLEIPRVRTQCSVSYLDHNLLYVDHKTPDDHIYLQSIAKKYGLYLSRPGNGICHSVHSARFGIPGKTIMGSDSHTTSAGSIGMLSFGAGGMDVARAMAGLPMRFQMPSIVKVNLIGKLNPGVTAKDVILEMLRRYGVKGGLGKVFEYVGEGTQSLEVPERLTITNMGAEMGATSSIFPADDVVRRFFKAQNREKDFVEILPDQDAQYDEEVTIDLSQLQPLVACPSQPDQVKTIAEAPKVKVHQVYIGSCTNASYADIKKAAMVLKGKKVHEDVQLTLSVSTRQIFKQLLREGIIEDLIDAGARITEIACGACTGIGQAPPTKGVSVRTSNRNFPGRSGTADAQLYLVSPEVAAATAITGVLTEAKDVMEDVSILARVKEPLSYVIDDSMMIKPLEDGRDVEIIRGPNIKPLPINDSPTHTLRAKVSLKAEDNISTDDITPANAQFSSMRSNIPLIAEYAYSRYDAQFVQRAKEMKTSIIVGGENYGQGSSREHAAITPMFLGVKAVLVKSMARIHKNNLVNHGVIPILFENPADYEHIDLGDEIEIKDLIEGLKKKEVTIFNQTKGNSFNGVLDLSDAEVNILLCGGQLAYIKSQLA
ncbi:aconitate hydratase [Irregularibacter muris]|uniref:Aconitate hydratase n=1 Tax=Irregularibacter muris TaxID=1796619 RepID=A0AAE3L022_9FIRM|nr:aconitate hydratase [Irregularibacter muris]MCR1899132.1 aconitate hydratase [Irregularibacter muris]